MTSGPTVRRLSSGAVQFSLMLRRFATHIRRAAPKENDARVEAARRSRVDNGSALEASARSGTARKSLQNSVFDMGHSVRLCARSNTNGESVTHLPKPPTRSVHPPPETHSLPSQAFQTVELSHTNLLQPRPVRSEPRDPRQFHSCPHDGRAMMAAVSRRRCALGQSRGGKRASLLSGSIQSGSVPRCLYGTGGGTDLEGTKSPADAQSAQAPSFGFRGTDRFSVCVTPLPPIRPRSKSRAGGVPT